MNHPILLEMPLLTFILRKNREKNRKTIGFCSKELFKKCFWKFLWNINVKYDLNENVTNANARKSEHSIS